MSKIIFLEGELNYYYSGVGFLLFRCCKGYLDISKCSV